MTQHTTEPAVVRPSAAQHELTVGRSIVVASMTALMVFAKQIAFFLVEDNRYFFLWRRVDAIALSIDVLLTAAALVAVTLAVRRWSAGERLWNRTMVMMLTAGAISLLPPHRFLPPFSRVPYVIYAAAFALCVLSLVWRRMPLMRVAGAGCLIMTPLAPILAWQLLTAPTWSTDRESSYVRQEGPGLTASPAGDHATPVYLFVFDEWSFKRTTDNGVVLPEYPRTKELSNQALAFQQAWSYSTRSYHSLPALIFQIDQRIQIGPGVTYWTQRGADVPTSSIPSLLGLAKQHGYQTAMQGFYLPYGRILGQQADYVRAWPVFPRGDGMVQTMGLTFARNLQWLVDPITLHARRRFEAKVQSEWWYELNKRILGESLKLIDDSPKNTFAVFHWPLPHGPFVINPDGTYHGQYPEGNIIEGLSHQNVTVDDYRRHLAYHDRVIGQLIDHLRASGKYDDALVIMTSDHSWRPDPIEPIANWTIDPSRRRVPLYIKLPHAQQGQLVSKTVYNNLSLRPIIEAVIKNGQLTDAQVQTLINGLEQLPTPTGKNSVRPGGKDSDLP